MIWKNAYVRIRMSLILKDINLQIQKGDGLGIIGPNGSGKTILAKAILGIVNVGGDISNDEFKSKIFVPFHSHLSLSNGHEVYRQQRWNKIDTDLLPKVMDEIRKIENQDLVEHLLNTFGLENFVNNHIVNLSNGEQRKLELLKALSSNPDLMVLDNAFTGLDKNARQLLAKMLNALISEGHTIVMTGLTLDDFPAEVKKIIFLKEGIMVHSGFISEFREKTAEKLNLGSENFVWADSQFNELINLNNVSLKYGNKVILDKISWQVNAGERWVLLGPNGSGKTSLLNMIFGDNPKAYGCDIRLFGKQKGSGESIWDIKKKIGFISPEFHQYVSGKQNVVNLICSGFNEIERVYKKSTGYQRDVALRWLKKLGYGKISDKNFDELSTSAQRVVLILRTLVKNPPLLILDEPFQGLDNSHIRMLKNLLNEIASNSNCAMIFVTHVPEEIPECFSNYLELKDGEIVNYK